VLLSLKIVGVIVQHVYYDCSDAYKLRCTAYFHAKKQRHNSLNDASCKNRS